jgi:hypothetical protein
VPTVPTPDDGELAIDGTTRELLRRLGEEMAEAESHIAEAYASGYIDALIGAFDPSRARIPRHGWSVWQDSPNQRLLWQCACGVTVAQRFGAPVPRELLTHPQGRVIEVGEVTPGGA